MNLAFAWPQTLSDKRSEMIVNEKIYGIRFGLERMHGWNTETMFMVLYETT